MKKFISLLATIVLCLAMGVTAMASTDSPSAEDPSHNGQSGVSTGTGTLDSELGSGVSGISTSTGHAGVGTPTNPMASPSTGDLMVVPALAGVALAGGTIAGVSKNKMKKQIAE